VKLLEGKRVISCKWIFKRKEGIPSVESTRNKARFIVRGFDQEEGIDFSEVFSPVVRHTSIRILLALVALYDLELEQLYVKTAFLHGTSENVSAGFLINKLLNGPAVIPWTKATTIISSSCV